jgi:hypothetical protein
LSPFAVNTAERDAINAAMKSQYRTVAVTFEPHEAASFSLSNAPRGGMAASMAPSKTPYGSGFADGDDIGNAVKLSMQATVELRRRVKFRASAALSCRTGISLCCGGFSILLCFCGTFVRDVFN